MPDDPKTPNYSGSVQGLQADDLLAQWQKAFDATADSIFILDLDHKILNANRAAKEIFNKPLSEMIGKKCFEIIHSSKCPVPECPLLKLKDTHRKESMEMQLDLKWYNVTVEPIFDINNNITSVVHIIRDITERVEAYRLIRESEERYRLLAESSKDLIITINLEGKITFANKAALDFAGLDLSEAIDRSIAEFLTEEELKLLPEMLSLRVKGDLSSYYYQSRILNRQGKEIFVEAQSTPMIRDGKVVEVLIVARDITERKRKERELIESEERYRDLVENISDLICTHDLEGNILSANRAALQISGYEREEVIGKNFREFLAPEVRSLFDGYLKEIKEKGRAKGIMKVVTKSGEIRLWEYNNSLKAEKGREPYVRGYARDVTESFQAQKALKESEEKYRVAFENISEVIYIVDRELRVRDVSPSVERILGWKAEELIGRNYNELSKILPEEYLEKAIRETNEILEGRRISASRYEFFTKDGERKVGEVSGSPWIVKGQVQGIVCVARDITERERIEREAQLLREQFYQAQKLESIGRLASGIAHDFNNILSIIMGFGELLLKDFPPGDKRRERLQKILDTATRAAGIVRQLLAFSRKQALEPKVLDLNELIISLSKMLGRLLGEDIELRLLLAPSIAPIYADPVQMEQVIMNIVVNARDAMPTGGTLTIETREVDIDEGYAMVHQGVKPGRYVLLAITDTGCGMDKEVLSRIFEPFFTTKEKGKGTGLGLSTAYGIVKQHGGNIWAYSEPGKGSTFKIYLPVKEEGLGHSREEEKKVEIQIAGGKVLVAEDEANLRVFLGDLLKEAGFEVELAESGEMALELVEKKGFRPDILIADVVMPELNGKQLYALLKDRIPELKVLYMSGYTDSILDHYGVIEEDAFIQKPFNVNELLSKLGELMRKA